MSALRFFARPASWTRLRTSGASKSLPHVHVRTVVVPFVRGNKFPLTHYTPPVWRGTPPQSPPQRSTSSLVTASRAGWGDSPLPPSYGLRPRVSLDKLVVTALRSKAVLLSCPICPPPRDLVPRSLGGVHMVPSVHAYGMVASPPPAFGRLLRSYFGL